MIKFILPKSKKKFLLGSTCKIQVSMGASFALLHSYRSCIVQQNCSHYKVHKLTQERTLISPKSVFTYLKFKTTYMKSLHLEEIFCDSINSLRLSTNNV